MPNKIPAELQIWIDARQRFRLSDAHVQIARELGLNPRKFGGLANQRQEPWKKPLPKFVEHLYFKRFAKTVPDRVVSIEQRFQEMKAKKKRHGELPVWHGAMMCSEVGDAVRAGDHMGHLRPRRGQSHIWVVAGRKTARAPARNRP